MLSKIEELMMLLNMNNMNKLMMLKMNKMEELMMLHNMNKLMVLLRSRARVDPICKELAGV